MIDLIAGRAGWRRVSARSPRGPRAGGLAATGIALFVLAACGGSAAPDRPPRITLSIPENEPSAALVEVRDLPASTLSSLRSRALSREEWTALLRVSVAGQDADAPAVAGAYEVTRDAVRFTPRFPFDPGRQYEVRFDPARLDVAQASAGPAGPIVEVVSVPKNEVSPSTVVSAIYPSSDRLPENQLRFYVTFSAPMGLESPLRFIHLVDDKGREVKDPFLPVEAEFWNADRTRYTVFVDPGRVKRGVLPHEQLGPSLVRGRACTMVIDPAWRDAQGLPLKEGARREFRVGPPDAHPLDTGTWRITAPAAGTRDPLVVTFPEPLDYGLLQRALGVTTKDGSVVSGGVTIDRHETRWSFTPQDPWTPGEYRLVVLTILEDLAGNRIGRAFEVDRFDRVDRRAAPDAVELPFRVGT